MISTKHQQIQLMKPKTLLEKQSKKWGKEAEQKATLTGMNLFRAVTRSGEPLMSQNSLYGEYDLNRSLADWDYELTEQKRAVSMGDFKDKGATPTISQAEIAGKDLYEEIPTK